MHHQTAGNGEGVLIQRSRGDAGKRRRARQPAEFCRRDTHRGDSLLRAGCSVPKVPTGSAEPSDQHRSANHGRYHPGGHRPPLTAGPERPGGSSAIVGRPRMVPRNRPMRRNHSRANRRRERPAPQPVTGRVLCTGVGAGAGAIEDVGLGLGEGEGGVGVGEDDVGLRVGEDGVGVGVWQVHVGVGVGVGEDDVGVGVGVGVEEGQDTQNTFCLAAPCSPANVQKSL